MVCGLARGRYIFMLFDEKNSVECCPGSCSRSSVDSELASHMEHYGVGEERVVWGVNSHSKVKLVECRGAPIKR